MTFKEFSARVKFSCTVQELPNEVLVRVSAKLRDTGGLLVNVGARLDREVNNDQLQLAWMHGTPQPLNWEVLIRGAKRILLHSILAHYNIQDIPNLTDDVVEALLN